MKNIIVAYGDSEKIIIKNVAKYHPADPYVKSSMRFTKISRDTLADNTPMENAMGWIAFKKSDITERKIKILNHGMS